MRHHCAVFPKLVTQKSTVIQQNTEQKLSENCSINQKEQPVSSLPNQCWAPYSNIFYLLLFSYSF